LTSLAPEQPQAACVIHAGDGRALVRGDIRQGRILLGHIGFNEHIHYILLAGHHHGHGRVHLPTLDIKTEFGVFDICEQEGAVSIGRREVHERVIGALGLDQRVRNGFARVAIDGAALDARHGQARRAPRQGRQQFGQAVCGQSKRCQPRRLIV